MKIFRDVSHISEENGKLWYPQATSVMNKSGHSGNAPREQFGKSRYRGASPNLRPHPRPQNVQFSKNGQLPGGASRGTAAHLSAGCSTGAGRRMPGHLGHPEMGIKEDHRRRGVTHRLPWLGYTDRLIFSRRSF